MGDADISFLANNSLIELNSSLFFEKLSLLIFSGNMRKVAAAQGFLAGK
jgi:hypothetical protein